MLMLFEYALLVPMVPMSSCFDGFVFLWFFGRLARSVLICCSILVSFFFVFAVLFMVLDLGFLNMDFV